MSPNEDSIELYAHRQATSVITAFGEVGQKRKISVPTHYKLIFTSCYQILALRLTLHSKFTFSNILFEMMLLLCADTQTVIQTGNPSLFFLMHVKIAQQFVQLQLFHEKCTSVSKVVCCKRCT